MTDKTDLPPDPEGFRRETRERVGTWNELGRTVCNAFVDVAERIALRSA